MKETQLVKQILDFCRMRGLLFYRTQSGMIPTPTGGLIKMATAGTCDITGCQNGKFVAVECKVGKNTQTPSQVEFQRKVEKAGGEYWLVYSIDEFIKNLK